MRARRVEVTGSESKHKVLRESAVGKLPDMLGREGPGQAHVATQGREMRRAAPIVGEGGWAFGPFSAGDNALSGRN
jgi:hypothetical protein